MTTPAKAPLRNGLRDISVDEFWRDPLIVVELLRAKLDELPIDARRTPKFDEQMRTTLELLGAIAARRYTRISLLATLDLLYAAHYFLLLTDPKPDSETGGYNDDAEVFQRAFLKHEEEIHAFQNWLREQS